jgi:hypothetical protein
MTDPRLALSSNPGQVEPGPFSEHDLREQWNAQADQFNQWESLDTAEQLAWAQTRATASAQFPRLARLMQEPTAFELGDLPPPAAAQPVNLAELHDPDFSDGLTASQHLDVLRGGPDPRADQAKGPSLAEIGELCEEFGFQSGNNGALLWADTFRAPPQDPLQALQEMITAAITRWPAPVAQPAAQPVDLANLMRLTEGVDPFAPGDPDVDHILALAQILEEVDGRYDTYLEDAKAILAHPGFSGCHDDPAASAVSPVEPSPVVISEAQNIGEDELYTNWYRCPQCKDDMITPRSNFCPKCGVKLQWEEGVTHA